MSCLCHGFIALSCCAAIKHQDEGGLLQETPSQAAADHMLDELIKGNARFASGQVANPRRRPEDFRSLAEGQKPGAIILGCSDSRVPPELVFDVGVGDLFVIRIAGNIIRGAGVAIKGSIEYAVAELKVPL